MKRPLKPGNSAVFGDILTATTVEQRAWIGAVVLAYTEAERSLHELAGCCLGFVGIGPAYSVTSRINGTDGLVAIISQAATALGLPEVQAKLCNTALSGFAECKGLRDAIGHVELSDTSTQTGTAPGKRGKKPSEVLLTAVALEGLYRRLVFVKRELANLQRMFDGVKMIKIFPLLFGPIDDQRRVLSEQDIQDATARCRSSQSQRLSLPPFPKFPDPPTVDEVMQKWLTSREPNQRLRIIVQPDE